MFQQNSCSIIAQGRTPAITMDTSASQDIKQFMFQASGGKDIDAVNNVEAKAKKIYERACNWL
jgi:diacylglycerol kinase family enzyme